MCRFQINGRGSKKVTTSETTLIEAGIQAAKRMFTQEPSTSKSQALCTGVHSTQISESASLIRGRKRGEQTGPGGRMVLVLQKHLVIQI